MYDYSDWRVVSGNYLKIQSISLRYQLPRKFCNSIRMKSGYLMFTGTNLYTFANSAAKDRTRPPRAALRSPCRSVRPTRLRSMSHSKVQPAMKKILAILFSGVLLAGLPSCGDFLESTSQTLSYVDDLSDLDELLIGGAYLEDRSQVCKYLWINYMDDDCKEEWFGPNEGNRPMNYIRGIYLWERYPWWEDKSVVQNTANRAPYGGNPLLAGPLCQNRRDERRDRGGRTFCRGFEDPEPLPAGEGQRLFPARALYFTLTNLWGLPYVAETASTDLAVPLKTESAIKAGGFARNSVQELYDQIVKDLKMAVECLQPVERSNKLYANASAARLLLARCYLYMCDWAEARKWAGEVIADVSNATFRVCNMNDFTSSAYQTATTADRSLAWSEYIFLNGWQVILMNTTKCPQPSYSDELYGSYASNDLRKSYWFFKKSPEAIAFRISFFRPDPLISRR